MIRLEMKNWNVILTEKQQKSALSSGKIDKNEYLTGEEILPSDKIRVIEILDIFLQEKLFKKKKKLKFKEKTNKNNCRSRGKTNKELENRVEK